MRVHKSKLVWINEDFYFLNSYTYTRTYTHWRTGESHCARSDPKINRQFFLRDKQKVFHLCANWKRFRAKVNRQSDWCARISFWRFKSISMEYIYICTCSATIIILDVHTETAEHKKKKNALSKIRKDERKKPKRKIISALWFALPFSIHSFWWRRTRWGFAVKEEANRR